MNGIDRYFAEVLEGHLQQLDTLGRQTQARIDAADQRAARNGFRVYPTCCSSAFCGSTTEAQCETCRDYPALQEFRAWVRRTGATVADPIWSPLVYEVPA